MVLCTRMCQEKAAGPVSHCLFSYFSKAFLGVRWLMNDLGVKNMKECSVQKISTN